jgi:hypothetical protein
MHQTDFFRRARIVTTLLAGFFLIPGLRAQPTEQTVQGRFLFIFDTSHDMKYRVGAVQKALNTMLATSLSGQLHAGDSMGVWTFGQNLRPEDYPLQNWDPDKAVMIASNLVKFVGKQHYAKSTRFAALHPLLNEVVQSSERLTVLIFCDGGTKISGTPFDSGINQIFGQKLGEQKETHQPFVVVLRSQLGQYVGSTVTLPPLPLNLPQFPPLPPPPPTAPKPTNVPPPEPVIVGQPLIIIGTKSLSSPPLKTAPTNSPTMTNPPSTISSAGQTNASAIPPANPVPTNVITRTVPQTNAATDGSPTASSQQDGDSGGKHFIIIGAGLFGAAIVLGIFVRFRSRRNDPSLITRSMNDRK